MMSNKVDDLSEDELDELLGEIMMTEREFILSKRPTSQRRAALTNKFDQIAARFYWSSINTQIRIKDKITKTSAEFNKKYFFHRSEEKNALAISSNQSKIIDSFETVQKNFEKSLKNDNLKECPKYWGGFSFTPYEIEFWEGNKYRLNKRNLYIKEDTTWNHFILQP